MDPVLSSTADSEALEFIADLECAGSRHAQGSLWGEGRVARGVSGPVAMLIPRETAARRPLCGLLVPRRSAHLRASGGSRSTCPTRPQDDDHQNALNSGADGFMGPNFRDANAPTWREHGHRSISTWLDSIEANDRLHRLPTAAVLSQPSGSSHASDPAPRVAKPARSPLAGRQRRSPPALFRLRLLLYFFHCGRRLWSNGSVRTFTCRRWSRILSARCGPDVFRSRRRGRLDRGNGTVKATVADRDVAGRVRMDEMLYELRDHSAAASTPAGLYYISRPSSASPSGRDVAA